MENNTAFTWVPIVATNFGIQWVGFAIAALAKTEKFFDLFGSLTFISLICIALFVGLRVLSIGQYVQATLVFAWACRLGFYLFYRIIKAGGDKRFGQIKKSLPKFFLSWNMQGIWVLGTLVPTLLMLLRDECDDEISECEPGVLHYIGWLIWLIGFLIEFVSDSQKIQFRNNPDNAGQFIRSGLWSISRHPNYFGEILLWIGLWLSSNSGAAPLPFGLTVLSPIFVAVLIIKVSGLPPLEKSAKERWGTNPEYIAYVEKTCVLIPFVW